MDEIGAYINQFPAPVQDILTKIRTSIKTLVPDVEERMAYGMPGYYSFKKPLIYFAAYKNHIGIYATPSGHTEFKTELSQYKQGKGSVQFPIDKPIPFELIERIIQFRALENKGK